MLYEVVCPIKDGSSSIRSARTAENNFGDRFRCLDPASAVFLQHLKESHHGQEPKRFEFRKSIIGRLLSTVIDVQVHILQFGQSDV